MMKCIFFLSLCSVGSLTARFDLKRDCWILLCRADASVLKKQLVNDVDSVSGDHSYPTSLMLLYLREELGSVCVPEQVVLHANESFPNRPGSR